MGCPDELVLKGSRSSCGKIPWHYTLSDRKLAEFCGQNSGLVQFTSNALLCDNEVQENPEAVQLNRELKKEKR
jgi:hypothetical protein